MTSWTKRIGNCASVIQSILNSSITPDKVYLNLSLQEFPNKQQDLPMELVNIEQNSDILDINWIPGENTKSFKKVFPILEYINDDDFIITADDDTYFPIDLIESRLADYEIFKTPISSLQKKIKIFDGCKVGQCSLFQKKCLNNWYMFVTNDVIKTYNDDRTYAYICWLNGYVINPCSKYTCTGSSESIKLIPSKELDIHGIRKKKLLIGGKEYDKFVKDTVLRITGLPIKESFGYFNKTQT